MTVFGLEMTNLVKNDHKIMKNDHFLRKNGDFDKKNLQILTLNRVFFEARNLKINCCFTIFGHFGIRKWKIIIWAVSRRRNRKIGPGIVWRSTWRPVHVHNYRYGTLKIKFSFFHFINFLKVQNTKKIKNSKLELRKKSKNLVRYQNVAI